MTFDCDQNQRIRPQTRQVIPLYLRIRLRCDGWEHEVLFEGCLHIEKGGRYQLYVEDERNCPPEDVGGVWDPRCTAADHALVLRGLLSALPEEQPLAMRQLT